MSRHSWTRLARRDRTSPAAGDGAQIYQRQDRHAAAGPGAGGGALRHQFASSRRSAEETELFCYSVRRISYEIFTSGRGRLAIGPRSHRQRHHRPAEQTFRLRCCTSATRTSPPRSKPMTRTKREAFDDIRQQSRRSRCCAPISPKVIRLLDRYYGHVDYSLTSLFTDEQRRIVQLILNSTLWDIESSMTTHLRGSRQPAALSVAGGLAQAAGAHAGRRVCHQCGHAPRAGGAIPSIRPLLRSFLALAKADKVPLETATLSYIADQRMKRAMIELQMSAGSLEMLDRALTLARIFAELAVRAESVAGAEHLVRDSAHVDLRADVAGIRGPAALGQGVQRTGGVSLHRSGRDHRPGSGGCDYGRLRNASDARSWRAVHRFLTRCCTKSYLQRVTPAVTPVCNAPEVLFFSSHCVTQITNNSCRISTVVKHIAVLKFSI